MCGTSLSRHYFLVFRRSSHFEVAITINSGYTHLDSTALGTCCVDGSYTSLVCKYTTKYYYYKPVSAVGYSFTGTGDWILQDGTWSFSDLTKVFKQRDVELALNEQKGLYALSYGHWRCWVSRKLALGLLWKETGAELFKFLISSKSFLLDLDNTGYLQII